MGWDERVLPQMPYGIGDRFPAILTKKLGVDKDLVNLMRPLFAHGLRPAAFADLILELQSKEHLRLHLMHENEIARGRLTFREMFEDFSSPTYGGRVPSGQYFCNVYNIVHRRLREYFDKEMKKRQGRILALDHSFKTAKRIKNVNGDNVFKAVITAVNEYGEIRLQCNTVTDGRDQVQVALAAMQNTIAMYGQQEISVVFTDKPHVDKTFIMQVLPSLRGTQESFPAGTQPPSALQTYNVEQTRIAYKKTQQGITDCVDAIREHLRSLPPGKRVVGLDTEWEYLPVHQKTAVVQLAYIDGDANDVHVAVLHVKGFKERRLSPSLVSLLTDPDILFVGRHLRADIQKLARDFDNTGTLADSDSVHCLDVAAFAKSRNVITHANCGLANLAQAVLGKHLPKDLRNSPWNNNLDNNFDRLHYAAADAAAALEMYFTLEKMPDYYETLSSAAAVAGCKVDIVPSTGSAMTTAACIATGHIVEGESWECTLPGARPATLSSSTPRAQKRCIVEITDLFAPFQFVPKLRVNGEQVVFADLRENPQEPFRVMLPLKMLAPHIASRRRFPTSRADEPSDEGLSDDELNDMAEGVPVGADEHSSPSVPTVDSLASAIEQCDGVDTSTELSQRDIELVRAAEESKAAELDCDFLDPVPESIPEHFSCVLGDAWHFMDRPKVPMHHDCKKAYFVALRRAWFVFDPIVEKRVINTLKSQEKIDDEEIEARKYFNFDWFRQRIPRFVPPPPDHYRRVRAVFATFGPRIDARTNKPLFDRNAWAKANNVLKEILQGHAADPPGQCLYKKRLNACGEEMTDKIGLCLYDCLRGTNRAEAVHRQMLIGFGAWHAGLETADNCMAEWRHRYNQKQSCANRPNSPTFGHVDTWKVVTLQKLVKQNRGVELYRSWVNSSDFKNTQETFGTVPLQSAELAQAINDIDLEPLPQLTGELAYSTRQCKTKRPFCQLVGGMPNHCLGSWFEADSVKF